MGEWVSVGEEKRGRKKREYEQAEEEGRESSILRNTTSLDFISPLKVL